MTLAGAGGDGGGSADSFDVVVVGCGPVGVMFALRCVQRGLSVLAIDRSTEVFPLPRAIGMDEEIQGLFERAGLIEPLRDVSTAMYGAEFVDRGGTRVVGFDLPPGAVGPLGHPRLVMFDQPSVERFLRRAASDAGVRFELGIEVTAIDQGDEGVSVSAGVDAGAGEERRWRGRYLVGADGARSTVRRLLGIELVDQGFDQTWLVTDTTLLDPDLPLPTIPRQVCDPDRICTFVPGHGTRRRWEFRLVPGEAPDGVADPSFVAGLLAPWGTPEQLQVDRAAVYRFHATVADRFRDGRVFIAGDAAHQMPPFNGQGMCTGLRDAENLSWKLAEVIAGRAPRSLLDTYDVERRPHAADQVAHAVDAGRLIEAIALDGDAALESGYGQRPFPGLAGGLLFGDHPLVGKPLARPRDPDLAADAVGDGWLVYGVGIDSHVGEGWARAGATVRRLSDGSLSGINVPTWVIVRPDRIVAAVTDDLAGAAGALLSDPAG